MGIVWHPVQLDRMLNRAAVFGDRRPLLAEFYIAPLQAWAA